MHFIITFGFQTSKKFPTMYDQSVGKKKVTKKGSSRKGKRKKVKSESETTYPPNIINVGAVLAEIHVEYEFLPGYIFKFDCRCWETATKIYTENGDWSLRPVLCPIEEDIIWVIFSIHHLVELNETQLENFFNHVITYRIFYGKKKFSGRANKDKVKKFYIDENFMSVGPYDFLEIYSADLNKSNSITKPTTSFLPEPITITHEVYGEMNILTYLDMIPDEAHQHKFRKMSEKDRFPSEFVGTELLKTEETSSSKTDIKSMTKKRLKAKKSSKRKKDAEVAYEIHLPAETIFSDMGTNTSFKRTPLSTNVSFVSIYTECRDILSNKRLRMDLNPLAIKLEQISNFPADLLIEYGFKYLYVKIVFLNRTISTPYYIPDTTIRFEFIKCFLCKEFRPEELINALIAKPIIVKVIGIRNVDVTQPTISVPKKSDKEASVIRKLIKTTKEEILLGIAKFDVSDLLRGIWELRLISSLFHPCNIDLTCINDTNDEEVKILWEKSPLTNDILSSYDTLMKVKVRLSYDLRKIQHKILRGNDILNRIFFILNDTKLVNNIVKKVSFHNSSLLKIDQISDKDSEDSKVQDIPKEILTGFVIDNCDKFYIFLEGLSNGYLLNIWKMVADLPFQDKCVYYNSSFLFLTRLYEDFVPFGGIIHIKLSDPVETQLRKCSLYIGEMKKTFEADLLKKMGLMKLTSTIKSLCQSCLFPKSEVVEAFLDEIHKIQFERFKQPPNNN